MDKSLSMHSLNDQKQANTYVYSSKSTPSKEEKLSFLIPVLLIPPYHTKFLCPTYLYLVCPDISVAGADSVLSLFAAMNVKHLAASICTRELVPPRDLFVEWKITLNRVDTATELCCLAKLQAIQRQVLPMEKSYSLCCRI